VCTQLIVDTMLKQTEISVDSNRRSHRTYSAEFKAQLVAQCLRPGVSIAALAGKHGMNANVLHRWLKEHQGQGRHGPLTQSVPHAQKLPAFIPLSLPGPTTVNNDQQITIELRKGALTMLLTWPLSAAPDLASWTAAVLK
jgi:transposase